MKDASRERVPFRRLGKGYSDAERSKRFVVRSVYNPSNNDRAPKPGDLVSEDWLIDLVRHHGAYMVKDVGLTFDTALDCYRFYCDDSTFLLLHDLYGNSWTDCMNDAEGI